jgi:hypothetical protein
MSVPYPYLSNFMNPPGGPFALPPGFGQSGLQTAYGGPQTGTTVLPGGLGPGPQFQGGFLPNPIMGQLPGPQFLPNPIMGQPPNPADSQWLGGGMPGGVLPPGLGDIGQDPTFALALQAMQQGPAGYGAPPITPMQPYGATPSVLPPQLATGAVPQPPGIGGAAPPAPAPAAPPAQTPVQQAALQGIQTLPFNPYSSNVAPGGAIWTGAGWQLPGGGGVSIPREPGAGR